MAFNFDPNNFVNVLMNAGSDAQSNLFKVDFSFMGGAGLDKDTAEAMSIRCEDFTPPTYKQDTYTVNYGTAYIERPRSYINLDRTFNLKFRVDANYKVYAQLKNIYASFSKPSESAFRNNISNRNDFLKIKVSAYIGENSTSDSEKALTELYCFENCWIDSMTTTDFTTGEPGTLYANLKVNFFNMTDFRTGAYAKASPVV